MVETVSTQRRASPTDAAEIASHRGGRVGICLTCGYEWNARSTNGSRPARCPECGSSKRAWVDQMTAEQLAKIEPLRHTINRKLAEPDTLKESLRSPPKPTPAARETAKQMKKVAEVAEPAYNGSWTMIPGKHPVSIHKGKELGYPYQTSKYYLGYISNSGFFRIPESEPKGYATPYEARTALEKIASGNGWELVEASDLAEVAEATAEPEKISLAGLPEGVVQTIRNPALYAEDTLAEPGYVAWVNEAGETEYGVIVREDLLEAMRETVAAETAADIIPVGLEDVEILREAGLLDVAHADEFDDDEETEDEETGEEEEIEEEDSEDEPEEEPKKKKRGLPLGGALIILGGMAVIAFLTINAPVTQKITKKEEPSAAEKAMYRVSPSGKLDDTLTRISRNTAY